MALDKTIFKDKTLSDLLEEIHKNSSDKKVQIDLLISELTSYIQTANDVVQIVPLISQYLEVAVKNDEQLIKVATLVQRLLAVEGKTQEKDSLLSESEKEQLLKSLDDVVVDLNKRNDDIQSDVKKVKNKSKRASS